MRNRRPRALLATAVLPLIALATVACSSPGAATSPEGAWGSDAPQQPQLTLAEDGSLSGTDGCNRLIGSWELVEERAELSPLGTTMMFCEGVDTWLGAASSATAEGDTLHVFDESGAEIGTLQRQ